MNNWVQSYAEYQPCPEPINKWNAIIFSFVLVYYEYKSTKLSKDLKLVNHVKTIQLQIFFHNYRYKNKHKQDKNHVSLQGWLECFWSAAFLGFLQISLHLITRNDSFSKILNTKRDLENCGLIQANILTPWFCFWTMLLHKRQIFGT